MAYTFTDYNVLVGKRPRAIYWKELQDAVNDLDARVGLIDGMIPAITAKHASTPISTYPKGFSYFEVTTGTLSYPAPNGLVETLNLDKTRNVQHFFAGPSDTASSNEVYYRQWIDAANLWSPWNLMIMQSHLDVETQQNKDYSDAMAATIQTQLDSHTATINALLDATYIPPTIAIGLNPSATIREYGSNVTSMIVSSTTAKTRLNLTKVEFYRDGALISTQNSPASAGGTDTYTDVTGIYDTTTYMVKAYDGKGTSSASQSVTYVYPFYVGSVPDPNPTQAQIKAMTKLLQAKGTVTFSASPTNARFAISYPKSYGALTSIKDKNGFETIDAYTRTQTAVMGLNNVAVDYYTYTLNNTTTQTNFANTFKF